MDEAVLDALNLVNSNIIEKQNHGIEQLNNILEKSPKAFSSSLENIEKSIQSLLDQDLVRWDILSEIVTILSSVLTRVVTDQKVIVLYVIHISYIITETFLNKADYGDQMPNLYELRLVLLRLVVDREIFMEFVRHCTIGFLPKASFIACFTPVFFQIVELIISLDESEYNTVVAPLGSCDEEIACFFMCLWTAAIPNIKNLTTVRQAISTQAQFLIEHRHSEHGIGFVATFLFELIKATPNEIPALIDHAKKLRANLPGYMKEYDKESREAVEKKEQEKKPATNAGAAAVVQRATVEIYTKGVFSAQWEKKNYITFISDAGILMWGKSANQMKDGNAINIEEVVSVTITDAQKKGKMNVLAIKTKKDTLQVAFESAAMASQWANVLHLTH